MRTLSGVTYDELVAAVRDLDGRAGSVSSHPNVSDLRPIVHVQGVLHRDDVDDTADWFRFVSLERPKICSADWREAENGG
jgi:hypothetical protein